MSDLFDFGFTAVDEDELDAVQKQQQKEEQQPMEMSSDYPNQKKNN